MEMLIFYLVAIGLSSIKPDERSGQKALDRPRLMRLSSVLWKQQRVGA